MQLLRKDPTPARLVGLDLLRAVAILLVLFAHCPVPGEGELPSALSSVLLSLKRGGWVGVDLFFVLSGFLVSGLLMREHQRHGSVRVGRFLIRRGWKIYPPLIAFVCFMVVYDRTTLGYWPTDRLIATALFIQNYTPGMQTHLWSLAVEEHAYLLIAGSFGLAALIARRRRTDMPLNWMPWAITAVLITTLVLRVRNASGTEYGYFTHQFPTHLRIDGILSGVLFAYFYHYHKDATANLLKRGRLAMLLAGVLLILPPFIWTRQESAFIYTYGLTTNYLAGLLLLAGMLGWRQPTGPLTRLVAAVGVHSYSIYLWHMTAYFLLLWAITGQVTAKPTWDGPYALHLVLFMAVGIVSGIVLSVLIEVPTLRLRDRLSPSRSGALAPTDSSKTPSRPETPPAGLAAAGGA